MTKNRKKLSLIIKMQKKILSPLREELIDKLQQKKPSVLQREYPAIQNMKCFCLPGF
jgi:hypothetical protein